MKQHGSLLTQSQYYSPVFDSAIFDGPFRIYFAPIHEDIALKIYFYIQKHLSEEYQRARESHRQNGRQIFIMLYPNIETFKLCFGEKYISSPAKIHLENLGDDIVIGLREGFCEQDMMLLQSALTPIISQLNWEPESPSMSTEVLI